MALLLALVIWALCLISVYFCFNSDYWLPPAWSVAAQDYNRQFMITMIVVGVAFISAQVLLGWFIFKYRDQGKRARYVEGNSLIEIGGIVVTGITFVALAVAGQRLWAGVHLIASPPDAMHVEVVAQQFNWTLRYPGADGVFGRVSPEFYNKEENPSGRDMNDPAGKDDFTSPVLEIPVNKFVELHLRSWDVIHSFFLPPLRMKQDAVPGITTDLRFTANQTGTFEIACAELCGASHYNMKTMLMIVTPEEYQQFLTDNAPQPETAAETPAEEPAAAPEAATEAAPESVPAEPAPAAAGA
jgi:cytochrome c oxidase subunit 2